MSEVPLLMDPSPQPPNLLHELVPLGPLGFDSPNKAQRHALPQKGLQIKHFCFRIAFTSPVQKLG